MNNNIQPTDDSAVQAITSGVLPLPRLLQFADATLFIQTITVDNESPISVNLFPGLQTPQGIAPIIVGPYQQKTIPIQQSKSVAVSFTGQPAQNGYVYIHYTTSLLPSTSGGLPGGTSTGTPFTYLGNSNIVGGVATLTNVAKIGAIVSNAPGQFPIFVNGIYITDFYFHVGGTVESAYDVNAVNSRNANTQGFGAFATQRPAVMSGLRTPIPLYLPVSTDKIGDFINLSFSAGSASANATVVATLNGYVT